MTPVTKIASGPIALIDRLSWAMAQVSASCLWGIFVLIMAEIIARNAFGTSIHFSWDFAGYLMGAAFTLAAPAALHRGAHVRVTALRGIFPPFCQRYLDLAVCVVGFLILAVLTFALGSMAWFSFERGTTSATVSLTPLWIPQAVMAMGTLLTLFQIVAQALRVLSGEGLTGDNAMSEI